MASLSLSSKVYNGLSPLERRMEQINRVKEGVSESYFDKEAFKEKVKNGFILYMIDFETSSSVSLYLSLSK